MRSEKKRLLEAMGVKQFIEIRGLPAVNQSTIRGHSIQPLLQPDRKHMMRSDDDPTVARVRVRLAL